MKKYSFETIYGSINYSYIESKNTLVFRGSFIELEYRNMGKFKEMVKQLFYKFPIGTKVQVPISEDSILNFFKRLDFHEVKEIIYWGSPINCTLLEGEISEIIFKKF